jgi:hypothetical protein
MIEDYEPRHTYKPSMLFERRGDRMVLRGLAEDRPYERIFRLKLWLAFSLVGNLALVLWLVSGR